MQCHCLLRTEGLLSFGHVPRHFNQFVIAWLPLYLKFSVRLSCCRVANDNIAKKGEGMERKDKGRNRQRRSTSVERFVISNCDN